MEERKQGNGITDWKMPIRISVYWIGMMIGHWTLNKYINKYICVLFHLIFTNRADRHKASTTILWMRN